VHWPQLGVGAIVCHQGKVLLVKRGRAPSEGLWSIPGGKVQPGEPLAQAVAREILEETGVRIDVGGLAWHFEFIDHDESGAVRYHYVVLDYYGSYLGGEPRGGDDAAEARWVGYDELASLALNASSREALQALYPFGFSGE
jgi:ADP-ribose pyrophosphatase YjhB (NUDIX family)